MLKRLTSLLNRKTGSQSLLLPILRGRHLRVASLSTLMSERTFLERFPITVEQSYPTVKIENKILENVLKTKDLVNKTAEEFTKKPSDLGRCD